MGQEISERALDDVRVEFVEETTKGTTPSDPSWTRIADFFESGPGYSTDASVDGPPAQGSSDTERISRGARENSLAFSYWMQQFPVDGSGDPNDPFGEILNRGPNTQLSTHTVVWRREQTEGGNDDAGFRDYVVGRGAYPLTGTIAGDPGESSAMVLDLGYEQVAYVENHVIHQPSSGTTLEVSSSDSGDTSQTLTIEDDGASTTEDVSLNGMTTVTTSAPFASIDAAHLDGETVGDVTITDGSGTTLLTLYGTGTDGVDGQLGVPALGSGSHGSAIGTDPETYQFIRTSSTFGGALSSPDRLHALDLSVEIDASTEAQQGTRAVAIDPGMRTVTAEVDVAGPWASATRLEEYLHGRTGDLTFTLPDGDIVVKNAQATDVDDKDYSAGDANNVYGVTFTGQVDSDSAAVTATNN